MSLTLDDETKVLMGRLPNGDACREALELWVWGLERGRRELQAAFPKAQADVLLEFALWRQIDRAQPSANHVLADAAEDLERTGRATYPVGFVGALRSLSSLGVYAMLWDREGVEA